MTYEPWKQSEYLIRFEHILDKTDDPELSNAYSFNISEVFPGNYEFTEMNLAANQRIEDVNRLHFRQEGNPQSVDFSSKRTARALTDSELTITLNPMQIRTFIMSPVVSTTQTVQPTVTPTAAPTVAPTVAPTSAPSSANGISRNIFKFLPLVMLAMIWKNVW